jgi:hypothetical protein
MLKTVALKVEEVAGLEYKELQAVARELGIKANQKKEVLVEMIQNEIRKLDAEVDEVFGDVQPIMPSTDVLLEDDDFFADEVAVESADAEVAASESVVAEESKTNEEESAMNQNLDHILAAVKSDIVNDLMGELETRFVKVERFNALESRVDEIEKAMQRLLGSARERSERAQQPSEPKASEAVIQEPQQSAKLIEFVKGTELAVHYRFNGKDVIVGWSKEDFRMYMYVKGQGKRLVSYGTMIDMLSKYQKGVHGDVGLVVKALNRIKKKPAKIVLLEQQAKAASGASRLVSSEENRPRANRGVVDAEWLAKFRAEFEASHDRQPTGIEIKRAWEAQNA